MNQRSTIFLRALLWCGCVWCSDHPQAVAQVGNDSPPVAIGTRIEMFVDDWLLDPALTRGVSRQLQTPVRREVVLTTDKPWEGGASAYFTVFQDGARIRLYYRGFIPEGGDASDQQLTCYAESDDGVHFVRPNLGLYEFQGSKDNNILLRGVESHNFAPFLDSNPAAKAEERYKALAGMGGELYAFASADGIRWNKIQAKPVMTNGTFDSLNLAFWDETGQCYRSYSRYFDEGGYVGHRSIQNSRSQDFIHWDPPTPNSYGKNAPNEHFYTSATLACPGAPHHYLAFPMRFVPDRKKIAESADAGVSDAIFMTSRNGQHWDRTFLEAWVRPGPDDRNWTQRSNMPAWGVLETAPHEFSMYITEHYMWPDHRLRRLTVRRHGFASMHAGFEQGEFTTRPLTFSGNNLVLNYATSATGSVQVEVQNEQGRALPGYSLAEMDPLFGDELDAIVKWKSGEDLTSLIGASIRFRFALRDADLFAIRTETAAEDRTAGAQ